MTAKHTPGPWRAERIGGAHRSSKEKAMAFRVEAPEANGPKEWEIGVLYYKPYFENAEANARLIAAAPELLAALEGLVRHEVNISGAARGYMHAARAAIAKARGEG